MVYYREGYVPQVYDQQVSTHLPAPETSWGTAHGAGNNPRGSCPVWGGVSPAHCGTEHWEAVTQRAGG